MSTTTQEVKNYQAVSRRMRWYNRNLRVPSLICLLSIIIICYEVVFGSTPDWPAYPRPIFWLAVVVGVISFGFVVIGWRYSLQISDAKWKLFMQCLGSDVLQTNVSHVTIYTDSPRLTFHYGKYKYELDCGTRKFRFLNPNCTYSSAKFADVYHHALSHHTSRFDECDIF